LSITALAVAVKWMGRPAGHAALGWPDHAIELDGRWYVHA
jgi:hypothetical protein